MLKEKLNKIKEFFVKGGSNWVILVISLLLAFFMWSSNRLSENYSAYLKYRVDITTNLDGRANNATSTGLLYLNAYVSGFKIIENNNSDNNIILLKNLDSKYVRKYKGYDDTFYLLIGDVKQKIQDALGSSMQIEAYATDTLFFNIPVQSNKLVPVIVSASVSYDKQYMPLTDMQLNPDSVYVYGDASVISEIESVSTAPIRKGKVKESFNGVVDIIKKDGVRYSSDEVYYSQTVVRYIENEIEIPVTVTNAPSNSKMIVWPKDVNLKYRVPFYKAKQYSYRDFEVTVDYNQAQQNSIIKPTLVKSPKGVIQYSFEPKFVECLF